MRRKSWMLCLVGLLIASVCNLDKLLGIPESDLDFLNTFLGATFDCTTMFKHKSLVLAVENMFMLVFFVIILGNYFSHDIHGTGIYYLTKERSRTRWYIRHVVRLGIYCLVYLTSYLGGVFFITMKYLRCLPTMHDICVLLIFVGALFFLLFVAALTANVVAVIYNEVVGVCVGVSLISAMLKICLMEGEIKALTTHAWMRYINPGYAVTLYSTNSIRFIGYAVAIYLIEGILLILGGRFVIEHIDLYGNKKEAEG